MTDVRSGTNSAQPVEVNDNEVNGMRALSITCFAAGFPAPGSLAFSTGETPSAETSSVDVFEAGATAHTTCKRTADATAGDEHQRRGGRW